MTYNENILESLKDLKEIKNLSERERQEVEKILKEYSQHGKSETYNALIWNDYEEIPVDIHTFLHDKKYLGNALYDPEGRFTLFPYWEKTLKDIFPTNVDTKYNTLILTGAIGLGKAQPLNSLVLTDSGFKKMGDLSLEDKIYGNDGKLHKLLGIFPQGKKKVYKVTFTDNSSCECCDEHLWTILPKNRKEFAKTIELKDLLDKPLYKLNQGKYKERLYYIPMSEPIHFEHRDMYISPYILGALIGDGSLTQGRISFTSADIEIINRFNRELDLDYILKPIPSAKYGYGLVKKTHSSFIDPTDNHLKQTPNKYTLEINKYGLNVTSKYKFIPKDYLYNNIESRIALLQGLLDTDGTIRKDGFMQFNTISPQLRDDFIWLIQSLGGSAWFIETQASYHNKKYNKHITCNTSYTVNFKLPKNIQPFYLSRKAQRINSKANDPSRAIDKIEYIGEKECQCIYIDSEEHLYLTDNFIVTHNTLVAVICLLYLLYRLLCLKDPYLYYGMQPIDKISISLMNITLENAKGVALDKMNQMILSSEWFMSHGKMTGESNLIFKPDKHIELITASSNNQVIGRAIFANFTDEVNFGLTSNVEKLKNKEKRLISQIDARMASRYMREKNGVTYLPTLNIIASSKNSDQAFLEDYIDTKKKNESKTTLIVDEPQWVVDSRKDSPEKFYVAIGNKFLPNELLPRDATEQLANEYRDKGYNILAVPKGYWEKFTDNIDNALMDIAGIATASSLKYISGARWKEIKTDSYQNLFTKEIIEVGNGKDDYSQYSDFFDLTRLDSKFKRKPMFIHLDMSKSGDKTGIAGVWIAGKKPKVEGESSSKELFFRTAFTISIKAPKGFEISFDKNRTFIRWLREQGFNIRAITSDTYQSAQIQQELSADGFDVKILSVDRLDSTTKQCLPYAYLKSAIHDRRLEIYQDCTFLTEEILGLERESDGHINHPENGTQGSKDSADALCGAIYNASQYADEFAYEFGEDLQVAAELANTINNPTEQKKQIQVAFEQELTNMFGKQNLFEQKQNQQQEQKQQQTQPVSQNKDIEPSKQDFNGYTQEDLEKSKGIKFEAPKILQQEAKKPVIIQGDMIIW